MADAIETASAASCGRKKRSIYWIVRRGGKEKVKGWVLGWRYQVFTGFLQDGETNSSLGFPHWLCLTMRNQS